MSDERILQLCQEYGRRALEWRNKFIGLLPEVQHRGLYRKKSCRSIYEFAAKFGGVSRKQVDVALRLEKRLSNLPSLHKKLTTGSVSINKLSRVVSVVDKDSEQFWDTQIDILTKAEVETLVRDVRNQQSANKLDQKNLPGQNFRSLLKTKLSTEVDDRLAELQEKGIDINAELEVFLNQREQNIEEEKKAISEECKPVKSRTLNKATKNVLKREYGEQCSIATCRKPSTNIHHTQRFALSKTHDPHYLAPLCAAHHGIAHKIDLQYATKSSA